MRSVLPIVVLLALAGCTSAGQGQTTAAGEAAATATPVSRLAPTSIPSTMRTAEPSAMATPSATSADGATLVGQVVRTLADDGLRVRSAPGTGGGSLKHEPLLPLGTRLYVLGGPVRASGYPWYEVVPLGDRNLPSGWVAVADRDGEPWVKVAPFACPVVPTDFRSLAALPEGVGLACFPKVPITVRARVLSCNCDADGPGYTPRWFFLGSGRPDLLVDPDVVDPPEDSSDWYVLNLDPNGEHPREVPLGQVVEVTGIFDHPAAARCTRIDMDAEPVPNSGCRLLFAVTRMVVVDR